jgi:lipopolysaccharide biosynthesis regulator YciM
VTLERWTRELHERPSLSAAATVLEQPQDNWPGGTLDGLRHAVDLAAQPLQRYRCAACGFEAQHYFWQCPGCLSWDSFPPQMLGEQ